MSASSLVRYPGPGCIVEFMHGNKPQQAWVLEEQGGKLRLFTLNKREMKLAAPRVLPWAGPQYSGEHTRQQMAEILQQHHTERETLAEVIHPLELWELAQGEVAKASIEWFSELLWETPSVDNVAALGQAMLACKTHFRFQPPDFEIFTAEKVEQRMVEKAKQEEREKLILGGQGFFRSLWERHTKGSALIKQPEGDVAERLKSLILKRLADPDDHEVEQVWKQLAKGLPEDTHQAFNLARAWNLVPPHYNFWFDRAGYDPSDAWAQCHKAEVDTLKETISSLQHPVDPTPFISIDAATTKDIDDAFHIEARADGGYHLQLALACPALCWPFGSELDHDVLRRGTSIYLPDGTYHMMPFDLGTAFFSLLAGEKRPALILECEISPEGKVESCTPKSTWVRLAANLTYPDCEAIIEKGAENVASQWKEQLLLASKLADSLLEQRIANGAVIIERPDPKVTLEGEGGETRVCISREEDTPHAMQLVSEMMILANSGVALWAREREISLLHRTQDVAVPKEYAGIWKAPHDIARVVKALSSAQLEPAPRPHRGIGVAAYSPITSPLRRYPDLVNVAQVIHYLKNDEVRWSKEELIAMLPLLNARLEAAGQVQRFRPRYWKLQYFKQQGDKAWLDAVVTDENDLFVTVSLPDLQIFVRGKRKTFGDKVYPGQFFQVRIGKVHPLNNEIQILDAMEE